MRLVNFITENKKNTTFDKFYLIFFFILPLLFLSSFLTNLFLTINVIFVLYYVINNKYYEWIKNSFFKVFFIFWLYIFINSFINFNTYNEVFKSFAYIRFLILFISVVFILPKLNINFRSLFFFYFLISLIFIIDVTFQFIFGYNLLGFPCQMSCQRNSSFFQDELIAGSFILHFGIFGLIYYGLNKNLKISIYLLFLILTGIFLTGDRSPLVISVITIIIIFFSYKKIRNLFYKLSFGALIILSILLLSSESTYKRYIENTYHIFSSSELKELDLKTFIYEYKLAIKFIDQISKKEIVFSDNELKNRYYKFNINKIVNGHDDLIHLRNKSLYEILNNAEHQISLRQSIFREIKPMQDRLNLVSKVANLRKKNNTENKWYNSLLDSQYGAHYLTALEIFLKNPYFGTGLKSYRVVCDDIVIINSYSLGSRCSTHPHNLHFEILSEMGLIGYIIFLTMIFLIFKLFIDTKIQENFTFLLIISLFFAKIFPFLPSGSLFSSMNSTYFWLTVSMIYLIKNIKLEIS